MRRLIAWHDAGAFAARVEPWLAEHDAEHNLPLGILRSLAERILPGEPPLLATVEDGDRLVTVLVRTPPHNLVLCRGADDLGPWLADSLLEAGFGVPGVVGPDAAAAGFAAAWHERTRVAVRRKMRMGVFELTTLLEPPAVPGRARWAGADDLPLVLEWYAAFALEATGDGPPASAHVARKLSDGRVVLWCNPEPVSMAAAARVTARGITVAPVYTPPPHRRHGYAAAVTAALCRQSLASGSQACYLYADLANATACALYERLGFRQVAVASHWDFGSPEA